MYVLVAGGTGVLGREAVPRLLKAGHDVTAVARSPQAQEWLGHLGARAVSLDLFDVTAVTRAAAGVDAVVNLATSIPDTPWPASRWATNNRLRTEASAALATAAKHVGARMVQESFAPAYPDRGSAWISEDVPLEPVDQTFSVVDAEASAQRVCDAGLAGVTLRFGLFYGAGSGQTRQMVDAAQHGVLPLPGPGERYTSMVHTADAATAVVEAMSLPAGIYNVVEDEPLTLADHAVTLAGLLGRSRVRLLPAAAGRAPIIRSIARSQRISNAKLRSASGWSPRYPSGVEGWAQVVGALGDG